MMQIVFSRVLLGFALLGFALLGTVVGSGCVTKGDRPDPFRIVSFNIRHGQAMDGSLEIRNAGWRIATQTPRFAGVNEVDQLTERVGGSDTCAILEETTGMHATFAKAINFGGGGYGNVLLSREKPISVRRVPLPGEEPRVLLLCEFDDCWAGVTHLAVDSESNRVASVAILERAVADCGPKPVFLMGDWNASPDSPVLSGLRRFLTVLSDERGATFHGGDLSREHLADRKNCIDYIAVDSGHRNRYSVVSRRTIPDGYTSDHYPIAVEIAVLQ